MYEGCYSLPVRRRRKPPPKGVRATYDDHLRLIGKHVVDFL